MDTAEKNSRERIMCFSDTLYKGLDIIQNYLMETCNIIRFTSVIHTKIGLTYIEKIGGERDKKFITSLKNLEPFLLKKVQNNMRFEDIKQGENNRYTHFFYKLSSEIKDYLRQETLLFDIYGNSSYFYGFEDPTFYIDDVMIACVISHEDQLVLYLTDEDMKKFNDNGFIFETKNTVIGPGKYTIMTKK